MSDVLCFIKIKSWQLYYASFMIRALFWISFYRIILIKTTTNCGQFITVSKLNQEMKCEFVLYTHIMYNTCTKLCFIHRTVTRWTDDLRLYVLFNGISVISGR